MPGYLCQYNGAGLWTLVAFFLGEANLRAYLQPVESTVKDTVAMKVNLAAVRSFDKAIAGLALKTDYMANHGFMHFDGTALFADVVFELPARSIKGFTDCLR